MAKTSAAASHVGKVRSSNQDSGYAGQYLHVVADGMGGHAGGDVASHLVIRQLLVLDKKFEDAELARDELHTALIIANDMLSNLVGEHPELAGLGTTVSAALRVGDRMVIAHIGDSRVYLMREGTLSQVTVDHTFVQRLIDSGRITEEEAHSHPRRSVLMRVLGDVDAVPEIDAMILETRPGDLWLLCSDGLTSVVHRPELSDLVEEVSTDAALDPLAKSLIRASLNRGAPDNVTVVLSRITNSEPVAASIMVGSLASELPIKNPEPRPVPPTTTRPKPQSLPISTGGLPLNKSKITAELDTVREQRIRRRMIAIIVMIAAAGAIVVGGIVGYRWSQSQFYVGVDNDSVVIYRGLAQPLGPVNLSQPYLDTDIQLGSLTPFQLSKVKATIPAANFDEAKAIVSSLGQAAK